MPNGSGQEYDTSDHEARQQAAKALERANRALEQLEILAARVSECERETQELRRRAREDEVALEFQKHRDEFVHLDDRLKWLEDQVREIQTREPVGSRTQPLSEEELAKHLERQAMSQTQVPRGEFYKPPIRFGNPKHERPTFVETVRELVATLKDWKITEMRAGKDLPAAEQKLLDTLALVLKAYDETR